MDLFCYSENVPTTDANAFINTDINYSTLHVPASAINNYRTTAPWSGFGTIVTLDGEEPVIEQCAKPTIHYLNGKLSFKCATEGVEFKYDIADSDVTNGSGSTVDLNVTYYISVYAMHEGYENSETATATLCWIDVDPQKEGIEDGVSEVKAVPVMIRVEGGGLVITGAIADEVISVYDLSGRQLGKTTAIEGTTCVPVNFNGQQVVIVQIGKRAMKVKIAV